RPRTRTPAPATAAEPLPAVAETLALTPLPVRRTVRDSSARNAISALGRAVDVSAVRYVFEAARDTLRKRQHIARLRRDTIAEQKKLDEVLAQLGRQARALDIDMPALRDEMREAKSIESRREGARKRLDELGVARVAAAERHRTSIAD